jgi:23S rRNA (uridine2552-2'-O)-methyltransferase
MGRKREQDHYGRRAKAEGRPARSVYKLEEIDQRWRLLRGGDKVLDLGCAPGSWLQYASEKVGDRGRVTGYDLKPVSISIPGNVEARVGDAFAIPPEAVAGPMDVVLSDMAPSTMGDHKTDAIRSAGLAERALDMAVLHLRRGGHVVVKVLEGGDVPSIVQRMRKEYGKVELLRPQATRRESTEIFLVGLGKLSPPSGEAAHAPAPQESPRS